MYPSIGFHHETVAIIFPLFYSKKEININGVETFSALRGKWCLPGWPVSAVGVWDIWNSGPCDGGVEKKKNGLHVLTYFIYSVQFSSLSANAATTTTTIYFPNPLARPFFSPLSLALYFSQWAKLSGMLYLLMNFVIFQMFMHFSSYKMSTICPSIFQYSPNNIYWPLCNSIIHH